MLTRASRSDLIRNVASELVTSGDISLIPNTSRIDATGTTTPALPEGTEAGQQKTLVLTVLGGGTATISVAGTGISSILLDALKEMCVVEWDGAGWFEVFAIGATIT